MKLRVEEVEFVMGVVGRGTGVNVAENAEGGEKLTITSNKRLDNFACMQALANGASEVLEDEFDLG